MTRPGGSVGRRPTPRAAGRKPVGRARAVKNARLRARSRYAIGVRDEQTCLPVQAARIRRIVRLVLAAEEVADATISVALVDNRAIRLLNRRHLNHDYETDVLSFSFESETDVSRKTAGDQPRGRGRRIDGEVVISAEMALRSAPRFGWGAGEELALYLVHGLLHLCGYDDRTEAERRLMRKRERAILKAVGK